MSEESRQFKEIKVKPTSTYQVPAAIYSDIPLIRSRPYVSQQPKRERQLVSGLTMRDIRDCMVCGILLSAGHVNPEGYGRAVQRICSESDLLGWDFGKISPMAALREGLCEVEEMMGIYPNMIDF